jgi:hypothetical protein
MRPWEHLATTQDKRSRRYLATTERGRTVQSAEIKNHPFGVIFICVEVEDSNRTEVRQTLRRKAKSEVECR